jgi:hypothetical protein
MGSADSGVGGGSRRAGAADDRPHPPSASAPKSKLARPNGKNARRIGKSRA